MTASNSTQRKQCSILLLALMEHGGLTTLAIREHLGILHSAGRINQLRAAGHSIDTTMVWEPDASGIMHKIARYSLNKVTSHD